MTVGALVTPPPTKLPVFLGPLCSEPGTEHTTEATAGTLTASSWKEGYFLTELHCDLSLRFVAQA